jgi:hypothetical protein
VADESAKDRMMRLIEEDNLKENEKEFSAWCDELYDLPEDFELRVKGGLQADLELQPTRWMNLGLNLLQSSKVIGHVQLSEGVQGPPLASFLPYPVFQMGAEIFLKGMWLCQFDELRFLTSNSYVEEATRALYMDRLGRRKRPGYDRLGHDLLKIIESLRDVPHYRDDAPTLRFLRLVESLIRFCYFPFYKADKGHSRWANARYPKRFYDDINRVGRADAYTSYPEGKWVAKLFQDLKDHLCDLWNVPG